MSDKLHKAEAVPSEVADALSQSTQVSGGLRYPKTPWDFRVRGWFNRIGMVIDQALGSTNTYEVHNEYDDLG